MVDVLIKAGSFVAIILLGYVLRKINFFKEGDFQVLSKIVLKISLPAALVSSLANKEIDPSLLFISLLGLGGGVLYIVIMYFLNLRTWHLMCSIHRDTTLATLQCRLSRVFWDRLVCLR